MRSFGRRFIGSDLYSSTCLRQCLLRRFTSSASCLCTPASWTPPAWWSDLDDLRLVVHITQGTIANTNAELIASAFAGLADEDVLVSVSTGGPSAESLGLNNFSSNARIGSCPNHRRHQLARSRASTNRHGRGVRPTHSQPPQLQTRLRPFA
jgi:hypothetical protein